MQNQRWTLGRDSYRPAGEVIKTSEYDVAEIKGDTEAKAFIIRNHYSRKYVAARWRFGLYHQARLVGVAVFSHPCSAKVLTNVFPGKPLDSVELGRFVLEDSVPGNGETWFLARTFDHLRKEGLRGVVSFSDPEPRTRADGSVVFPGHIGTIYQAHNAVYLGRGTPRTLRILPDGTVLSDRAMSKIRALERGWKHSAELLETFGAEPLGRNDPSAWLSFWRKQLTRSLRHPGNFKYCWALDRKTRRGLPSSLAYPKQGVA